MTQAELAARINNYFNNPTYYEGVDISASIQDGYDEIGAFSGLFLKAATIPYVANLTYYDMLSLLPDYLGTYAIFSTPIKRWLWSSGTIPLDIDRLDWETALGTPYYFSVVSHRYMAIYKKPAVNNYGNMQVYYKASSPTLGPNDSFALPDDFIMVPQDYVITDLWAQNQEWVKATGHLQSYMDGLKSLKKWLKSQKTPDRMLGLLG